MLSASKKIRLVTLIKFDIQPNDVAQTKISIYRSKMK